LGIKGVDRFFFFNWILIFFKIFSGVEKCESYKSYVASSYKKNKKNGQRFRFCSIYGLNGVGCDVKNKK